MVDVHIRVAERRDDDAGEILIVLDEEHARGTVAVAKDAAELREEEILVEGLLHPALGLS